MVTDMQHMIPTILNSKEAGARRNTAAREKASEALSHALPYEVLINDVCSGRFDDVRDAMASARIAKCGLPIAKVAVADTATGRMVIDVEA